MTGHDIVKALEVWTLQNLLNFSIMLGILTLGFSIVQQYYKTLEKHLTLRVSVEIWQLTTAIIVDVFLVIIVIVGYLVLNPDIMADIKMAVPFVPIATILFTISFFLRIFHGGHEISNPNFMKSIWFLSAANVINIIGFTFVMEAPSNEYLALHPSPFWTFIKTYLRSNASPHGLELSQVTFYICFPILMAVFMWGFASGLVYLKKKKSE
jgi:hypothetical protein